MSGETRREIRFGLIGLGRHGLRYATHLLEDVPGARLTAVCRRDEKEGRDFADRHGLNYYSDYRELIEDHEVDAIAAVVSPDLHPDICRCAATAGKHILLEKPLARNLGEAQQILKHLSGPGIKFMLAQTLRFNSVVGEIKRRIGEVGRIHLMNFNQHMEPLGLAWLDDPVRAGGGNILHTGVHTFDLIHFLTGRNVVWAWCRLGQIYQRRNEDLFTAVFELEDGIRCLVDSSKVTSGRSGRIEVVGEKGQLVGDHVLGRLDLIQGRRAAPIQTPEPVHTVHKALEAFVECVLMDRPTPVTAADGLRTLEVATMCYRSVETGRVVRAEEIAI
ncbi:Gfo/Idh/MocA family protein [Candidatus Zixiibacteriota bacterium]